MNVIIDSVRHPRGQFVQLLQHNAGDGNYGSEYGRPDTAMMDICAAGVDETCQLLDNAWVDV